MSTQERLGTVAVEPESAPDAYEAVTVFQATNADTTSIRAGRYDDAEVLEEPELQGKTPIYARRRFEPIQVIGFQEPKTVDEIFEWVDANRDHSAFEAIDWEAYDRKQWIATIVENRSSYNRFLINLENRLESIHPVGVETQNELEAIQQDLVEAFTDGPGCVVNLVETATGDQGGDDE
ncbi:hypothetical protein [Natronosalvus amylolyticus]|uniref:hypothetical protein n=1 Tax=Natronosalvus amylolyticus TaxID=2961994 RepID=UPI0020C9E1F8|nr:hypothetical protein [Natronosalvus amylolyticus]